MISDTLSDAIAEIERYQRECPAAYDAMRGPIGGLVAHMRHVRSALDSVQPWDANAREAAYRGATHSVREATDRLVARAQEAVYGGAPDDVIKAADKP